MAENGNSPAASSGNLSYWILKIMSSGLGVDIVYRLVGRQTQYPCKVFFLLGISRFRWIYTFYTPLNEKKVFGMLPVCSVCAPRKQLNGWTVFIHHRSMLGEYEHSMSNNRGPFRRAPKSKMAVSSKVALTILIKFK
jgi:hypothetical protein